MLQELLSGDIHESLLGYNLVSLHYRFVEVFSSPVKLVSSLLDDLPSLLRLLPVSLPYSIYPAFPVSLFNRFLGLICPVHGDLLDHVCSPHIGLKSKFMKSTSSRNSSKSASVTTLLPFL